MHKYYSAQKNILYFLSISISIEYWKTLQTELGNHRRPMFYINCTHVCVINFSLFINSLFCGLITTLSVDCTVSIVG
jgi:hypothetical protein